MSTNSEINKILGSRVRELRCKSGLTREKLAEEIEVSARFLANVEYGNVGVSLYTLKNICAALGTTSDYLLGLVHYPEKEEAYIDIENRIRQIEPQYLGYLKSIIAAFSAAVSRDI